MASPRSSSLGQPGVVTSLAAAVKSALYLESELLSSQTGNFLYNLLGKSKSETETLLVRFSGQWVLSGGKA